ncbi:MAG: nitroreductase family protein [Actinomycetales bacterium]|nr:nitroreductase family protein [Actinomycetales bacterium]
MDLATLLARRRMVRSFDATPVDPRWLDDACAAALWAPTAGNSAGVRMHTISADLVSEYFERATDPQWRQESSRAAGLSRAGAVVLVTSRPQDYLDRYAEEDKRASGLSAITAWPVPYWHTDAAMATMALLLLLEEGGWSAALWGNFRHDREVLEWVGAPEESLFASVLVGRPDGLDHRSPSLDRSVPTRHARVRRLEVSPERGP